VWIFACVQVCAYVCVCVRVCEHLCEGLCAGEYICVSVCVCVGVCVCLCLCVPCMVMCVCIYFIICDLLENKKRKRQKVKAVRASDQRQHKVSVNIYEIQEERWQRDIKEMRN